MKTREEASDEILLKVQKMVDDFDLLYGFKRDNNGFEGIAEHIEECKVPAKKDELEERSIVFIYCLWKKIDLAKSHSEHELNELIEEAKCQYRSDPLFHNIYSMVKNIFRELFE